MDDIQKEDIKMDNLSHINEVGGAEDTLDKLRNPGNAPATIAPQNGEIGGAQAIGSDLVRYFDFVNGKGDYGTAGRDHAFGLASLAIVNPVAAGAVVGAVALGAAIHGIATSTFVRFMCARTRMERVYKKVMSSDGYNPTENFVSLLWKGFGFTRLKDSDGERSLGPHAYVKYKKSQIEKFISEIDKSNILDAAGKFDKSKTDENLDKKYATANGYVISSMNRFYLPDSVAMEQQDALRDIRSHLTKRFTSNKEYTTTMNIIMEASQRGNVSPLYVDMEEQLTSIKDIGDGLCDAFDKKMGRALTNGKFRQTNASKKLRAMWARNMKTIKDAYNEEITKLISDEKYVTLRKRVEALSKVVNRSQILKGLEDSLNVGGLFGRSTNGKVVLYKVVDNDQNFNTEEAVISPVNVNHLGKSKWDSLIPKSWLFDRNKFTHYLEKEQSSKGSIKTGTIYKVSIAVLYGLTSNTSLLPGAEDDVFVFVDRIDSGVTVVAGNTTISGVRRVVYHLVNFSGALKMPQIAYLGGNLEEDKFVDAVKAELVEDPIEINNSEGRQKLQSGKAEESEDISFDKTSVLNEEGEENAQSAEKKTEVEEYKDIDPEEFKDCVYVLPGRYILTAEKDKNGLNKKVVVKDVTGGKVEYYDGDKKSSVSLSAWDELKPEQQPTSASELVGDTYKKEPPRNIPNVETHNYPKVPSFKMTYADFYKAYLHTVVDYKLILEKHKEKLSKYGLYVKDQKIDGVYARTEKGTDSDYTLDLPYNFTPYIRSLDAAVLFESEDDYKSYIPKESTEKTHESLHEAFNKLYALNESVAVNESEHDGKSLSSVKNTILKAIQRKWRTNFLTAEPNADKRRKILEADPIKDRDAFLKKVDQETIKQVIEDYKVHVLTNMVKETVGDSKYEDYVKRLQHIAQSIGLVAVDKQHEKNSGIDTDDKIMARYGRFREDVENVPDFESLADDLAKFQKEIRSDYSKLSAEDRAKATQSSKESIENAKNSENGETSKQQSQNANVNANVDTEKHDEERHDDLPDIDITDLIAALMLDPNAFYGENVLTNEIKENDTTNTPVEKPQIVKPEDGDLVSIIKTVCADTIHILGKYTESAEKGMSDVTLIALKKKKPEFYTFDNKQKDELIKRGDETKITFDPNGTKYVRGDEDKTYIVDNGRTLVKITDYNEDEDTFKFISTEGEYTIKGSDTIKSLLFAPAEENNEDTASEKLRDMGLDDIIGAVMDIREDVLSELTKAKSETVNDSLEELYDTYLRMYEADGDDVKYIRLKNVNDDYQGTFKFEDAQGKVYEIELERIKEFGIDKFNQSRRLVTFADTNRLASGKYTVDKDYFNTVIIEKSTSEKDAKLDKVDENPVLRISVNDDSQAIGFKMVTPNKEEEDTHMMSYLFVDPSKFSVVEKSDDDNKEQIEYKKDETYVIKNYKDIANDLKAHMLNTKESAQEYAYYNLYGVTLNEEDDEAEHILKIVDVDNDNIVFALSDDNYKVKYAYKKGDMKNFELEKKDIAETEKESFDPNEYEVWQGVPYPKEEFANLVNTLKTISSDDTKKHALTKYVETYSGAFANCGFNTGNIDEVITELIGISEKLSTEAKKVEGARYNMLYETAASSVSNTPILSTTVTLVKDGESATYYVNNETKGKFSVQKKDENLVFLVQIPTNESLYESRVGVSLNEHVYALYKLYGGSLMEAVNVDPKNNKLMADLGNLLLSIIKFLANPPQQPQHEQQPQQQPQQTTNTQQQKPIM